MLVCLLEHNPHKSIRKRKQLKISTGVTSKLMGGVGPSVVPEVHGELLGLADSADTVKSCCPCTIPSSGLPHPCTVSSSLLIRPITGVICELDHPVAAVYLVRTTLKNISWTTGTTFTRVETSLTVKSQLFSVLE